MKKVTTFFISNAGTLRAFLLIILLNILCFGAYAQTFTLGAYSVTVPAGVTTMNVTVAGAAGGNNGGGTGGKGGVVTATYNVTPGTTYYIYAGAKAANTGGGAGGSSYGGGEDGGSGGSTGPGSGAGGGAASDIRTTSGLISSRIVIGGGGGGGGNSCLFSANGGNGGNPASAGAVGGSGCSCTTPGGAGTTSSGGSAGGCGTATAGSLGTGGNAGSTGEGGGGGGYYGGGGAYEAGGGGGSSFATATGLVAGSLTYTNGTNTGDGYVTICFPTAAITGPSTVCPGGNISLSDPTPGGTWSSSNTNIATITTTGVVYGATGGSVTISYSTGSCPAVMTVNVSNLASITGPTSVCSGSTIYISDATAGGVWSSDNSAVATVSGTVVVTGGSSGTANISYTVGSCAVGVAITVSGSISGITGPTNVCPGSTINLSDPSPGGVWTSSNTSVATLSGSVVVHGITGGTTNISYTVGACSTGVAVTVATLAPITGPTTSVCAGSVIFFSDATTGGVWSSDNTLVATVSGGVTVTGASSGTANISYTVGACSVGVAVTVTGAISPITGPSNVCTSSTIGLSDATTGGTWSSSNTTRATVNPSTGVVYGVAAGTTTITYTSGACTVTTLITVGSLPGITGITNVCVGATTGLSDATTGGSWSSTNTGVATADPTTGVVYGVSSGTTNISYTTASCSVGITVTVGPLPAITGLTSVCPGSSIPLSDATGGGVWTSSNTSVATVSTTGVVYGVAAGTSNISYTTGPCSVGIVITVGSLPAITGSTNVCPGGTITLSDATTGGTWSSSNTGRATVTPGSGIVTGVAAGAVNITYTSGSCSVWIAVTVGPLPGITGATTLCAGSTITLSDASAGGSWSSNNTSLATVDPVSGVVTGVGSGTATITYSLGGCTTTYNVTVSGSLSSITGPTAVCAGSTIQLSDATGGGVWSSSNTTVATIAVTGVVSGVTAGTTNISYTVGTCSVGIVVTVSTLTPITGNTGVCAGSTMDLSDATAGGTWSSGGTTAATVSASGVVTGVASGSATIYYTLGACTVSTLVNVSSAVPSILGSVTTVCAGATISLSDAAPGGVWSSTNTGVATVSGGVVVHGVAGGTTTISYTIGGCAASTVITVLANNAGTIIGKDSICVGVAHAYVLSDSVSGGVWSSSNVARATVGSLTGIVTGVSTGAFTITYTVTNSCGTFKTTKVMHVKTALQCALGVAQPADEETATELQVFPNPNSGIFTMDLMSGIDEEVHVIITNIVGEKVRDIITTTNRPTDIKLDPAAGIYIISASTVHGRYVAKVAVH